MSDMTVQVIKTWTSGDFVYGAVRDYNPPGGVAHLFVDGREWPVARLTSAGLDANDNFLYAVDRWVTRTERFPAPIEGWNL